MTRRGRPPGSRNRKRRPPPVRKLHRWHMMRHEFAHQLKRLCDEQDVSAAALAKAIDKHRGTVLHWMRGRCLPTIPVLLDVASALDCSLVDLMPDRAHHR